MQEEVGDFFILLEGVNALLSLALGEISPARSRQAENTENTKGIYFWGILPPRLCVSVRAVLGTGGGVAGAEPPQLGVLPRTLKAGGG
jgi:hypothetical protein